MWNNVPENIEDYLGFVYIIENKTKNGKFYVGQKKFWFKKTLPPLKGKKRKRRSLVESDWKTYTGSSNGLNEDIESGDEIVKTILHLCESKFEMNYLETLEQFVRGALLKEECYNGIINVRIGKCPKDFKEKAMVISENVWNNSLIESK